MTDKELIKQEIERLHNLLPVMDGDNVSINYAETICTALKKYVDSLSEEPASKDLEDAAEQYARAYTDCDNGNGGDDWEDDIKITFKAGAEWQRKKGQETIELAEDHAMLAGMMKEREEMMKDAVNGEYWIGEIHLDTPIIQGYNDGDTIKVIPIKEE